MKKTYLLKISMVISIILMMVLSSTSAQGFMQFQKSQMKRVERGIGSIPSKIRHHSVKQVQQPEVVHNPIVEAVLDRLIIDIENLKGRNPKDVIRIVQSDSYRLVEERMFIIVIDMNERQLIIDQERPGLVFSNIDKLMFINKSTLGYLTDRALKTQGKHGTLSFPWPNRGMQKIVDKEVIYKFIPNIGLLVGVGYYPGIAFQPPL